ncbi:hypothetical protein [Nitrosospira briensis]|uniref:hypothetical protein n=1 Tax=Nitrosospira briensis TaxID=35799 RepID=UPI0012E32653|nr:hypothetical protein [Nitrosospira briensis]
MMGSRVAGTGTKFYSIVFDGLAASMVFWIYENESYSPAVGDSFEHQHGHIDRLRG